MKYQIKNEEDLPYKERRRLAVEKTFAENVPQSVKAADYMQFIREDRER